MALSNSENQKRYRDMRKESGDRHLTCWIDQDANKRLSRLLQSLGYDGRGKLQDGYSEVIALALQNLENNLNTSVGKHRYGLVLFNTQD